MESGFDSSTSSMAQSSSCLGSGNNDAACFECNICLDLAQDPIVTLCGHLFCWPCLYKWLHIHGHSPECPVCKAMIEEGKLVPLYGRGRTPTDPRSKPIPGVNIPNRPAGQRPETAHPPDGSHFPHQGFGLMGGLGGLAPMATARFGNFAFSAGFGGLFPSLLNFHVHGIPDYTTYGAGAGAGFPYGFSNTFHGGHSYGLPRTATQGQQAELLKYALLGVGVLVILALLWA